MATSAWRRILQPCLLAATLALAGCQLVGGNVAIVPLVEPAAVAPTITQAALAVGSDDAPPPPTLQFRPAAAGDRLAPVTPTAWPTETPIFPTMTPSPDATAAAAPTAVPSITPSPPPTFTPPALPNTPPWEHYWFWRPVPDGGVVWTDKVYPYGSTRGGTLRPHHGVEFNVPSGTLVLAAASGTVVVAGDDTTAVHGESAAFYGNLVVIEHESRLSGQPVYTLYGHLSVVDVVVGQYVDARAPIGLSGASGIADGPHLHFEVRVGANSYAATRNPLLWLYPFNDRGTVAGRVTWPDGSPAVEAPVRVRRIDAPSRYAATTTYALGQVNADEGWQENFVVDDVVAGYYEVIVANGSQSVRAEIWVYPFRTSFVDIVLSPTTATDGDEGGE